MIWMLLIAATLPLAVAYMAARRVEIIQRSWYRPTTTEPGDDWGDPHRQR
jgi:hypothetical protein